jgi:hypothetical protein
MQRTLLKTLALAVLLTAVASRADVLELKNGGVLTGQYLGGTAGTLRFQTAAGMQVIETAQALALTFTGGGTPAAPAAPVAAPAAAPAPASVTVAAGTALLVRMVDGASSRDYRGKRFTTTLEADLVVNGTMVARAGSKAYGTVAMAQSAGRFAGSSLLDLRLSELAVGGSLVPVSSSPYALKGANELGKTAKTAATGAAIGAIVDGGSGAGKGAAIGAGVSGLRKGQPIVVPPGSLLEFRLQQPLTVRLSP